MLQMIWWNKSGEVMVIDPDSGYLGRATPMS